MSDVTWFPVLLDLTGRAVVVVGGGATSADKVRLLLDVGADVTVVAPELGEDLAEQAATGTIRWQRRRFRPEDLSGAFYVVAATDDPEVNAEVHAAAVAIPIPVNAVDDTRHCTAILPSVHRDGPFVVAVSTAGRAPAAAVRARERIAEMFAGYGDYLDVLGGFRSEILTRFATFAERRDIWYRIVDTETVRRAVATGDAAAARAAVSEIIEAEAAGVER